MTVLYPPKIQIQNPLHTHTLETDLGTSRSLSRRSDFDGRSESHAGLLGSSEGLLAEQGHLDGGEAPILAVVVLSCAPFLDLRPRTDELD